jgi:hypothetical protein
MLNTQLTEPAHLKHVPADAAGAHLRCEVSPLAGRGFAEHVETWHALASGAPEGSILPPAAGAAIAFIHRFGSSLNRHEHFKVAWSLACQDRWTSRVFVAASKRSRPVPDFSAANVGTMIQSRWNEGLLDGTPPSTDGHHFMASTAGIGRAFQ